MVSSFEPIADDLRTALVEHYRVRESRTATTAWQRTLETNSGYAERRTDLVLEIIAAGRGTTGVEGMRVLDLGCGFGSLTVALAARGASVLAIDPNGSRMHVGRSVTEAWGLDARFAQGRMEDLPEMSDGFDIAVANNSLCYVIADRDRSKALKAALAALEPGGHLVIRDPNRRWPQDHFSGVPLLHFLPPATATKAANILRRDRSVVRVRSPRALRRELLRAGFTDVRSVRVSGDRRAGPSRYHHVVARRAEAQDA